MNPDVIVIPTDNFAVSSPDYTAEDVLNNATFADVTAVKNGAVYQMPVGFEAWDSPFPPVSWVPCGCCRPCTPSCTPPSSLPQMPMSSTPPSTASMLRWIRQPDPSLE